MKEKIKENNTTKKTKNEIQTDIILEEIYRLKDIIIIIISSALLISTKVYWSFGYSLGGIIAMLPTWIIETVIATSVIWGFKKEKASWLSCLSWGFLIISCLHLVLHLFKMYAISQLPPTF